MCCQKHRAGRPTARTLPRRCSQGRSPFATGSGSTPSDATRRELIWRQVPGCCHVVDLYDVSRGSPTSVVCYAMQFCKTAQQRELVAVKLWAAWTVVRRQVLWALQHMRGCCCCHRDIDPMNLLLCHRMGVYMGSSAVSIAGAGLAAGCIRSCGVRPRWGGSVVVAEKWPRVPGMRYMAVCYICYAWGCDI